MPANARSLAPARIAGVAALAALPFLATHALPAAPPPAHAQPAPPTRYVDLAFDRVTRTNDLTYATAIDKPTGRPVDLKLDIYEPAGDSSPARPVFVFLFGGGFVSGNKELEPRVYAEQMARRGYVSVAISYRLNQGDIARDGIPAAVADARQAVRWLRSNAATYRLDTDRIVIGGSSAGAITSLFLAYTDVARPAGGGADDASDDGSEVALVMDLWGGLYNQVNDLEAGEPPLAIVHGTADNIVPFGEATKLRDRAEAVGVPFAYHPLEGKGHAPYMPIELMTTLAPFFAEQLWPAGVERMPDLAATDRLHVSHRFMTLGRTDDASINVQRAPDAWHGTANFKVDAWQWRFVLEASEAVTISHQAMATFLDELADTPLEASLPLPTATAMPDVYSTFAFDLATGDDAIVGFTSHTSTFFRRRNKPYFVALDGRTWMTDGDEPDRALAAIYDALGFDTLDRLIREAELGPTAVPSPQPHGTATPLPKPAPRSRVWLPVAMR